MHGDFSRGHEPDRKRGRDYRRVLLQMGRPLLDSDVAASVDAVLGQTRALARGVGCDAGSPDLGFLVTPGRLLSVFAESAERVRATSGTPNVWIDYRWRLGHRYPALYVEAQGVPASVSLPPRAAADPAVSMRAALWAHVEEATTISVNGIAVPLTPASPDGPGRFEFVTGNATLDPLQITVPANRAVWLYLLEQDEAAGADPRFWIAPGSYHLDGLVVDARGGGPFPSAPFPEAAGFPWQASPDPGPPQAGLLPAGPLAVGARFVAYLEAWERHITDVEDPGIREEALGAGDTCTRAELLGQVKLAAITGAAPPSPYAFRGAFERVEVSGGRLTIDVPAATPAEDPCALPDPAGYRGSDNRLYRVEVHEGGGIGQVRFKWSRDNGSELFAARAEGTQLVFDAGTPLAGGDIVEILSNVTDLGDDTRATVSTGGFVPPWRAVGQLVQLEASGSSGLSDDVAFTLLDAADGVTPVILDERYGVEPDRVLKLRRWHGILEPDGLPGPHAIEEGLTVTVSETGSFRPGQYWQYEARVRTPNANGPWRETPHGPERRFAPLAVLEYQGAAEPMEVVAWLDDRFSPLCDLGADDVDYAGERAGTSSDTVQEALDEIYERLGPQITWPVVVAGGMSWQNDRILPLADFHAGLRVTFSEAMHPASATPSAFIVTAEVPADDETLTGVRSPLIVDGVVHVDGSEWTFVPTNVDSESVGRWATALGGPVRCRVRLLSHVILDITGERPLDGDTVGAVSEDGYNARIDLRLPSGDGKRGGDFESWFFLTAPPSRVAVDHVNPPDGGRFAPGDGPRTILLSFSDGVQFASLGKETLIVTRQRADGQEDVVPGTIQPYPFEVEPGVVTRVTFAPDDPEALRPWGEGETWTYKVRLRGSGDKPVVGVDERALDGERIDDGSDFVSSFIVETWKPKDAPKPAPKKTTKTAPKKATKAAPKRRAPKRTPKKPDEEPEG